MALLVLSMLLSLTVAAPSMAQTPQNVLSKPCTPCAPQDTRYADMDGDSDLDAVVTADYTGSVSWFENTGGTFGSETVIGDGFPRPRTLLAADFTGDNVPDVIVLDEINDDATLFINTGNGTFGPGTVAASRTGATDLAAGDVNGDGALDFVMISKGTGDFLNWWENDGSGRFTRHFIDNNGYNDVAIADVDGDMDLDILTASSNTDDLRWYENVDGNGTFETPSGLSSDRVIASQTGVTYLAVGDLDGVNGPDVVAGGPSGDLQWYANNSTGFFSGGSTIASRGVFELRIADVDQTNGLDVIAGVRRASGSDGPKHVVYQNDGSASFSPVVIDDFDFASYGIDIADITGDGLPDLLMTAAREDRLAWYKPSSTSSGTISFTRSIIGQAPTVNSPLQSATADIDGDSDLDLATIGRFNDEIIVYTNTDGAGSFDSGTVVSRADDEPTSLALGDLDGDGLPELIVGYSGFTNEIAFFVNKGGEFGNRTVIDVSINVKTLAVANADGIKGNDLIVLDETGTISLYLNDGSGNFSLDAIVDDASFPRALAVGDLENDGDPDILFGSTGVVQVYLNDGSGNYSPSQSVSCLNGTDCGYALALGDLNGDALNDIVTVRNSLTWMPAQKSGGFGAPQTIDGTLPSLNPSVNPALAVGNVDPATKDDDADVLLGIDTSISWYENDGTGAFGGAHVVSMDVDQPSSLGLDDLDGDTFLDVISTSVYDDKVAWYANPSGALPVELTGFAAHADGDAVTLTWTTLSESNNTGFAVERNAGDGFRAVTFVPGAGTTTQATDHRFTDNALPYGAEALTYRLRQVDVDGSEWVSEPVGVRLGAPEAIALQPAFPSPARTTATVRYTLPEAMDVTLHVYDLMGRRVATLRSGRTAAGAQTERLDVSSLASGTYFLRLSAGSTVRTQRIAVVR